MFICRLCVHRCDYASGSARFHEIRSGAGSSTTRRGLAYVGREGRWFARRRRRLGRSREAGGLVAATKERVAKDGMPMSKKCTVQMMKADRRAAMWTVPVDGRRERARQAGKKSGGLLKITGEAPEAWGSSAQRDPTAAGSRRGGSSCNAGNRRRRGAYVMRRRVVCRALARTRRLPCDSQVFSVSRGRLQAARPRLYIS
jgi:hypothetical protein